MNKFDNRTGEEKQNLHNLAVALNMFLIELDGYRSTCIAHDATTDVVVGRNGSLWLRKRYASSEELEDVVRHVMDAMEPWDSSPWGDIDMWEATRKRHIRDAKPDICKGVSDEGFPLLLMATFGKKETIITSVSPPATRSWQPDFPPRKITVALKCHERLAPEGIAQTIPVKRRKDGCYPIHAYLQGALKDEDESIKAMLHGWAKNPRKRADIC